MLLLALLACSDPDKARPDTTDGGDTPAPASGDPCARAVAGPGSEGAAIVALSEAHADVRLFGSAADFPAADAALAAALEAGADAPDLGAYAEAAPDACALDAAGGALGAAEVELRGDVAWIRPGTGEVVLPGGAAAAVIDLRGLPAAPELDAALLAAVSPALASDVERPDRRVRTWDGYVDQWFSESNVYATRVLDQPQDPIPATGAADLPLVVVTEARLAPAAAELAGALAQAGRAWIVGEDVLSAVAESTWSPVGERGLLWRSEVLGGSEPWPDVIPAALRTSDPDAALEGADLSAWETAEPAGGESSRAGLGPRDPYDELPDEGTSLANGRAALVIAHGALRRFFPYFDVVGDEIDERLIEVLARDTDPADQRAFRETLGRLGEAIHDGHCFRGSLETAWITGYLPVLFEHIDGLPVVRRSLAAGISPGDAVVAVDGVPIEDVYADLQTWTAAASPGYSYDLMGRELRYMTGATTYTLEDPDGVQRDLTVEPVAEVDWEALGFSPVLRANGRLDDLGAPEIAYLNLGETSTLAEVNALLAAAADAAGLVVDMRGYPAVDHYSVARRLIPETFSSPQFIVPQYAGVGALTELSSSYSLSPLSDPAYGGPVVLLVGPVTVSAAENFSIMLVGADRVTVVGRPSAATNGNITGVTLPGGYYLSFTGMGVLFPDGSPFHGIGIVPDVEVGPTAADIRDGRDPELEAAVEVLRGDG